MAKAGFTGSRLAALAGGIIIILVGVVFLLDNFFDFLSIGRLWPLFMLIPVIPLLLAWAERGKTGAAAVVPITILVFYAAYFLWLNYTSWGYSATTWPNYLIGPGLGLLILYLIRRQGGPLVSAFILLGLAALFYGSLYDHSLPFGAFLILAGLILIEHYRTMKSRA